MAAANAAAAAAAGGGGVGSGQQQSNAASNANNLQASSAANLTNALINQILELPNVGFLQPLPPNARDQRFLLAK